MCGEPGRRGADFVARIFYCYAVFLQRLERFAQPRMA
jgi:hypothetical protein